MVAPAASSHIFGKYSLVAKLATGGMAEIFLARLTGVGGFEKLVCIKRILPHLARDQALVGMFLAEARIAAQISHPNVCQVFELGEIDSRYFIAMEYLEGVPFSCFRRRDMYPASPDPRLVAGLGMQACEGLHHAHQLKKPDGTFLEVVHRDVSANNLFATVDGVVKVLDFGIAKVQDASVRTSTGSVKGTYAYMAPEQLRGERLDRRTDVFAMGIVLWEMFARKHLFKRDTEFLTFQAITTDPIPDVCEFRPDVPPELAATIAMALSRNREDRFPSARALGEALADSVMSLGGPLSASQISDEIGQAFAVRLSEQHELIRIARAGGMLDLHEDLGPGVGHGTAMITTPVSLVSSPEIEIQPPSIAPPQRRSSPVAIAPGPRSSSMVAPSAPRTATMPVAPLPRSRFVPILLTLILLGGIGAAGYFFVWAKQSATREQVVGDPNPAIDAAASSVPDATLAGTYTARPVHDAAVAVVAADAEVVVAAPPDAREITPDAAPPTRADRPPPPRPPPKQLGPPGFITIDSSPVYAVIFIDGKRAGETPLVRHQIAPGRHSVRAVSASGTSQSISINIESGKVAPTRHFKW